MTRNRTKPKNRRPAPRTNPATGAGGAARRRGDPARVKAGSPGDLLALVPYLLGFRPHESLVLILIRDKQVQLAARLDLPPVELVESVADRLTQLAAQHDAEQLVLFAFSEQAGPTRALLQRLVEVLTPRGLLDALYVDQDRWWSLTCSRSCCPSTGTPYDLSSHQLAAEAVFAGLTTVPSRSDVAALVSGPAAADRSALLTEARRAEHELGGQGQRQRSADASARVLEFLADPGRLSDADCVRLAVLVADVTVRDVAWALMTRSDADLHLDLWGQVVRRTVDPWAVAPVCLLGMAAWIGGNGALQNCCSDRARQLDPSYSLGVLLADINERALSPSFWDLMARDLRGGAAPLVG